MSLVVRLASCRTSSFHCVRILSLGVLVRRKLLILIVLLLGQLFLRGKRWCGGAVLHSAQSTRTVLVILTIGVTIWRSSFRMWTTSFGIVVS